MGALLGAPNFPATLRSTPRARSGSPQEPLRKHSQEHFMGFPMNHSCKWRAGSQASYSLTDVSVRLQCESCDWQEAAWRKLSVESVEVEDGYGVVICCASLKARNPDQTKGQPKAGHFQVHSRDIRGITSPNAFKKRLKPPPSTHVKMPCSNKTNPHLQTPER